MVPTSVNTKLWAVNNNNNKENTAVLNQEMLIRSIRAEIVSLRRLVDFIHWKTKTETSGKVGINI